MKIGHIIALTDKIVMANTIHDSKNCFHFGVTSMPLESIPAYSTFCTFASISSNISEVSARGGSPSSSVALVGELGVDWLIFRGLEMRLLESLDVHDWKWKKLEGVSSWTFIDDKQRLEKR